MTGVWIVEKTAGGKVIPLRELVCCGECVHRSVGVCLLKAMYTEDDDFCKYSKKFDLKGTK